MNKDNLIGFNICTRNIKLNKIIQEYSFYHITETFDINENMPIIQNYKETKSIIISKTNKESPNNDFFVICFQKTLLIIKQSSILLLNSFFPLNQESTIYFLPDTKDLFNQRIQIQNRQIESDSNFLEEIKNFNEVFTIKKKIGQFIVKSSDVILSCITGYLIQQSYSKLMKKQTIDFSTFLYFILYLKFR